MKFLLIIAILLVIFGGKKLGDLGKGLGEGIRNLKGSLKDDSKPTDPPATN